MQGRNGNVALERVPEVERAMWAVARMPHAKVEMIVRGLFEAIVEYNRTNDPAHLIRLADDAAATAQVYAVPDFEKALIGAPDEPGDPQDAVDVDDLLARLRDSS